MKKAAVLAVLLFSAVGLFAAETFDSQVLKKEEQRVYGSGTLSVASTVYSIWVVNKDVSMKIEVPRKAFDLLAVGDVVRITYEKGLFMNEIKKIALVRAVRAADAPSEGENGGSP